MTIEQLTSFFGWCSAINGAILVIWLLVYACCKDWCYNYHQKFLKIDRNTYNALIFGLAGGYKLLWFLFNVVPWISLMIVTCACHY